MVSSTVLTSRLIEVPHKNTKNIGICQKNRKRPEHVFHTNHRKSRDPKKVKALHVAKYKASLTLASAASHFGPVRSIFSSKSFARVIKNKPRGIY